MKVLEYGLGLLVAVALLLALLITSVEAVVYWNPGYFEKEYETYAVCDSVQMEMEDLLVVTDEMMAYLRGQRDTLQVETVVDGQKRGFFNAREIAHMEDVRGLFLGGLALRRGALLLGVCAVGILALLKGVCHQEWTLKFQRLKAVRVSHSLFLVPTKPDVEL